MKMRMQFEASGSTNILWGEDEEMRITAEIDLIPDCSDDFGYLTMKKAILERFPDKDFDFFYDGQEQYLAADASADGEVRIDIEE